MKRKFAAFDIDGTLFRSGLYREVVYELIRMEALPKKVLQAFAAKEQAWRKRSHGNAFYEFDRAMFEALDDHLPKLKVSYFDLAVERVIKAHRDNVYVYTRNLTRSLKAEGYMLIAISGSQTEVVEPFAKHYKFDLWVGAHYHRSGDYFTGEVMKTHKSKDLFLKQLIETHNLTLQGSYGVGDSGGDTEMLSMVENPIAFNPEQTLFEQATKKGWKIVIERKNMIYELSPGSKEYTLSSTSTH
ncbi:HAD-IB family hydrolase [soil metagenome]